MVVRKAISKRVRFAVFARDNFTCVYCGRQPPTIVLEIEHMVPVCQGGSNDETNLRASCHECNAGKAGKTVLQIVPTDQDKLIQAQELAEKRRQLEELAELQKQADSINQQICDIICRGSGEKSCSRSSITCIKNIMEEFGAQSAIEWLEIAFSRVHGEVKIIKYVCGIARNRRAELRGER